MIRRIATNTALLLCGFALTIPSGAFALNLVTEENPPFNYTEQGKVVGLSTEVVSEQLAQWHHPAKPISLGRKPYSCTDKETSLLTARLENRERLFTDRADRNQQVGVHRKSDFQGSVKTVEAAHRYRVGVVAKDAKIEYLMGRASPISARSARTA
jgi:polar amino acid transport system substrate-binding protein